MRQDQRRRRKRKPWVSALTLATNSAGGFFGSIAGRVFAPRVGVGRWPSIASTSKATSGTSVAGNPLQHSRLSLSAVGLSER